MPRMRERYADFGPTLAAEHLAQEGWSVSRETLRKWMVKASLWRPRARSLGGNANNFVNAFIGGWQFATIFTAHSGFAFSTTTGSFPVGFVFDSPAVLTGSSALATNIHDDNGKIQLFANPSAALDALSNPFGGQIGNRNNLRGPGYVNFDMSLAKRFVMPWSEKHTIQFRTEAYNVFNHTNFADPGANINSPTLVKLPLKPAGIAYCSSPCVTSSETKDITTSRKSSGVPVLNKPVSRYFLGL